MTRIRVNIEHFLLYFFIATKRMLKQTEPILKTRQHKESFKMQNNSMQNSYSVFIVHVVQYVNMKEKMQWLSV